MNGREHEITRVFREIDIKLALETSELYMMYCSVLEADDLSESDFSSVYEESYYEEETCDENIDSDEYESGTDYENGFETGSGTEFIASEDEEESTDEAEGKTSYGEEEKLELVEEAQAAKEELSTENQGSSQLARRTLSESSDCESEESEVPLVSTEELERILAQEAEMSILHPVLWSPEQVIQWLQLVSLEYLLEKRRRKKRKKIDLYGRDLLATQMDGPQGLQDDYGIEDAQEKMEILMHFNRLVKKYVPEGPEFAIITENEIREQYKTHVVEVLSASLIQRNVRAWSKYKKEKAESVPETRKQVKVFYQEDETQLFFNLGFIIESYLKNVFFQTRVCCVIDSWGGEFVLALYLHLFQKKDLKPRVIYALEQDEESAKLARARYKRLERDVFLLQARGNEATGEGPDEVTDLDFDVDEEAVVQERPRELVVLPHASNEVEEVWYPNNDQPDLYIYDVSCRGESAQAREMLWNKLLKRIDRRQKWLKGRSRKSPSVVHFLLFASVPVQLSRSLSKLYEVQCFHHIPMPGRRCVVHHIQTKLEAE